MTCVSLSTYIVLEAPRQLEPAFVVFRGRRAVPGSAIPGGRIAVTDGQLSIE